MKETIFRPMKPCSISEDDLDKLVYPVIVQPKLDGIRCIIKEGKVLSYNLKPIPNKYIVEKLSEWFTEWVFDISPIDGELLLRNPCATFQDIQSAVMSREGYPDFTYVVFDTDNQSNLYSNRYSGLVYLTTKFPKIYIKRIGNYICKSKNEILLIERQLLMNNYEGIIIRSINGTYKYGRSTLNEGYLLKLKRFVDAEAMIIGYKCLYVNLNIPDTNELGYSKRSSCIDNLTPTNKLGSLEVIGINGKYKDKTFNVGTGFTEEQRINLWTGANPLNRIITYKYQEKGSTEEAPRMPVFKAFREDNI